METHILQFSPLSGDFEEHQFSLSNDVLWVKFVDSEFAEWVGTFDLGFWNNCNFLCIHPNITSECFVVSGGQGYFVDVDKRMILAKTDWNSISSAIYNSSQNCWIISDGLHLGVLKNRVLEWSSERISLDGIVFSSQSGDLIFGKLNDLSDQKELAGNFEFNCKSKEIKANWIFYKAVAESANCRSPAFFRYLKALWNSACLLWKKFKNYAVK